jgi:hypothetical protein
MIEMRMDLVQLFSRIHGNVVKQAIGTVKFNVMNWIEELIHLQVFIGMSSDVWDSFLLG